MDSSAAKLDGRGAPAAVDDAYSKGNPRRPIARTPRYPVELIDVLALKDGQRVTIRPILPQDDAVAKTFFQGLSMTSRYSRFMRAFRDLPDNLLMQLTHVDYDVHLALIAEVFTGGREVAIGEARYVVSADGKSAEFAVSIADEWQGRGLGTLLLCRLIKVARKAGVEKITGETLASNATMLHLAHKAGFSYALDAEVTGLVHLSLSVTE
jgi:GNAT superfamily N-acetyltransferase